MSSNLSVLPTHAQFLEIYKRLRANKKLFNRTPVVFCEGDSWFSTPLAMNILDWLVFPTPEEEDNDVPIAGPGGLFFRDEVSGSLATEMFTPKAVKRLMRYYDAFEFDVALLSGGGNDFVGSFLKETFAGQKTPLSVDQAFARLVNTGRFDEVRQAYELVLANMVAIRPKTPIVGHTYCYPLKMGVPANLTLANIGAVVLLKKNAGPWIAPHIAAVLPERADQRAFVHKLIDAFAERVVFALQDDPRFRRVFRVVDLRTDCPDESDWFDEMHPTGASFHRLSKKFQAEIQGLFELP